jgi:hypothetical protein
VRQSPLFAAVLVDPNPTDPPGYEGQFLRGQRVMVQLTDNAAYPGIIVKDFQDSRPNSCGRRVIIDMGGHRWERFFDCMDLQEVK